MVLEQIYCQVNTLLITEGDRKCEHGLKFSISVRIILGCSIMGLLAKIMSVNVLTACPPAGQTTAYQCAYALSAITLDRPDH